MFVKGQKIRIVCGRYRKEKFMIEIKKQKNIAILGSTGSIGRQTLDVARSHPELFTVKAIAAYASDELLEKQLEEFHPELAVLVDEAAAHRLRQRLGDKYKGKTAILSGSEGLIAAATLDSVDTVVTSLMGFAGLAPTMAAIKAHKHIALANKETLVVAGELVMKTAAAEGVAILPVDSEHCALFQCLKGEQKSKVSKLIVTASGGPFRGKTTAELTGVTVRECLAHPTWSMGRKITVDSATLVNKGLEVIEAHWLYDIPYEIIQVVVHPQSIIHSMVEYVDGAVMAQLGSTDMRLPIQYALTYPERQLSKWPRLDFWQLKDLTFEKPDTDTFRGLKIAYEVGKAGGVMPCIFNGANEIAVAEFLTGNIGFLDIYEIIERTLEAREAREARGNIAGELTLELLNSEDAWAREYAGKIVKGMINKGGK